MSLFTIDISPLLSAGIGTTEEFQFESSISDDIFGEVVCLEPLQIHIKLIRQEYGIECVIISLSTLINIPTEGISRRDISIEHISREFHEKKQSTHPDDIEYIDMHDCTIDLTQAIEQELLIAGL